MKPVVPIEERLAKLERERRGILIALAEYHLALDVQQDIAVATGKLAGAVEAALGKPWKRRTAQPPTAEEKGRSGRSVALTASKENGSKGRPLKAVSQSAELLDAHQLAHHLGFPNVRSIYRLMAKDKIPSIRLGHRTVRFDLGKVKAALNKFERKEA